MEIRIETERLIIRQMLPEDADAHIDMMGDEATAAFLSPTQKPQSRADRWRQYASYLGHWQIRGFGFFSILEKSSGEWVGRAGPWMPEGWPGIECGWSIKSAHWGKGYAPEAAIAAVRWTFEQYPDLDRIISVIDPSNTNSQAVARKIGEENSGEIFEYLQYKLDVWAADRSGLARKIRGVTTRLTSCIYIDIYVNTNAKWESDMTTRRAVLITGTAAIGLIGGGLAFSKLSSDIGPARAPWSAAGQSFGDPRLDALAYAILAPNPHNRQPWLARLDGDHALTVFCDVDRLLPETDPPNRQITIGFGAFLELLRQAAAENGYRLNMTYFPQGEPYPNLDERPIAHVAFEEDSSVERDPLFGAALNRRTVRAPFDQARFVSDETFQKLSAHIRDAEGAFRWTTDPDDLGNLKATCVEAWRIEMETPRTYEESVILTRIGAREINQSPDGLSLSGPMMEALSAAGIISREKMRDPTSQAFKGTADFYNKAINTAVAFGWLVTDTNTRKDQLFAGASWMRLQLAATQAGLSMHPLSQALQEFPEMHEPFDEIHQFAGVSEPARVQGLFRFGYAKNPQAAPRWPVESKIVPAEFRA